MNFSFEITSIYQFDLNIHKDMALAAIKVLERQCWWLGERMIPLALLSRDVDEDSLSAGILHLEEDKDAEGLCRTPELDIV